MAIATTEQVTIEEAGALMLRTRMSVAMRDGTLLATDIYSPVDVSLESVEPRAVMLERSPYDVRAMRPSDGLHANGEPVTPASGAMFFVQRGYIVVRQDCRGRGASDGVFSKYTGEADDGFDTHAWLAAQPWCDGRIITVGVSYGAHVQAAAASVGATNTAAMIMDSGGFASAYETGGRFGGAFELKQVIWAHRHAVSSKAADDDPVLQQFLKSEDLGAWFAAMPWRKGESPLSAAPEYEDFLFDQWSHEDLDDFWRQPGLHGRDYWQNFPASPSLQISSWYDPYTRTAIDNFEAMRTIKHAKSFLVLGPWTHGARSLSFSGDVDFGTEATLDHNLSADYLSFKADWLGSVLAGAEPSLSPVTYFLMGGGSGARNSEGRLDHGGSWRSTSAWPPPESVPVEFFLHVDRELSGDRPSDGGSISYDFDPNNPVPSMGGGITSGEPLMFGGAYDQTPNLTTYGARNQLPLSSRADVVAFQTEPLRAGVGVVGDVVVELDFSSSAPDTDITVKLVDVYPPSADYPAGFAMNVTDGMLRCRYRNGFETAELMAADEVYTVRIPMPDTANFFGVGHRIRLDISSSNFPRVDVNPNTGRAVVGDRTSQVARNTLHFGSSRLMLHVLPG